MSTTAPSISSPRTRTSTTKASLESTAIPTPTHGSGGLFTILATTHISASPLTCLLATLNAASYPKWNKFCPLITIESHPSSISSTSTTTATQPTDISSLLSSIDPNTLHLGTKFTMDAYTKGLDNKPFHTKLQISRLEEVTRDDGRKGFLVAWKGLGYPDWSLRTERVQEFIALPDIGTEYRTWETMGGVLARVVKRMVGEELVGLFEGWGESLAGWCESEETGPRWRAKSEEPGFNAAIGVSLSENGNIN